MGRCKGGNVEGRNIGKRKGGKVEGRRQKNTNLARWKMGRWKGLSGKVRRCRGGNVGSLKGVKVGSWEAGRMWKAGKVGQWVGK